MDFFDNEYYRLTRYLMASIGLWPYQKSKYRVFCVSFILVLGILVQLTTFATHEYNTTLLIEVLSFAILCIIYALKYNIVYFNSNQVKKLFDQIQHDWNLVKDKDELKIIQKYANKTKFYTMFAGSIVYPGTFAFISIVFIPDVLDIIMPLDKPRPRQLPIHVEVFLDIEKYFYFITLLFIIAAFLGMTVLMATETMYMTCLQHACGLFELVSCRLTYAFNTCLSRTTPLKTKCKCFTKLLNALITHQHCLEFLENMHSEFSSSYFVLCVFGVASLSINMFRDIIDHSECFFQHIYNTPWYTAPPYAQKLLLITFQRSAKSARIIIGSLFVASLEGFATVIIHINKCIIWTNSLQSFTFLSVERYIFRLIAL
ncbi:uncharacterized protein [Anoplolepis gracilipes]|uniref:uncharacterized protein isoform X3 n=1 Tax=Anoplolepis gracilipes TaxID=354296 RepID=UPI003B9E36C8